MKVFLDTNFYVSEALDGRQSARIVRALLRHRVRILTNNFVLEELKRTLGVTLGRPRNLVQLICLRVEARATLVRSTTSRHRVATDPQDTQILQGAIHGNADFLVTNDRHLLQLHPYEGIEILSVNDFERLLRGQGLLS